MFNKNFTVLAVTVLTMSVMNFTGNNNAFAASTPTVSTVKTQKLPAGLKETSRKLNLWTDIYNSPKKVVVYSYMSGSTCPYQSQEFHNKVTSAASRSGGKYYARPTGPDKMKRDIKAPSTKLDTRFTQISQIAKTKGVNDPQVKAFNKDVQDFNKLMKFTNQCTLRACIINPSKDEYIIMNRKSDEVVKIMNQYK